LPRKFYLCSPLTSGGITPESNPRTLPNPGGKMGLRSDQTVDAEAFASAA
jgi:hypothetical protein